MTNDTNKRVLIIDDDPVIIKLVTTVLSSNGYEVLSSVEAPQGLEMAMKDSPDLIILDVMMPIVNGYNICRLLKNQETHKGIPIILLTSRAEEQDRQIGEEVGADAYIAKPFNTENLLLQVDKLLRKQ